MSDMVHFYRVAEAEAYTAGYAAGATTVIRKIPWPEAPALRCERWVNGFEQGQKAAVKAVEILGKAETNAEIDPGTWLWISRLYEMVEEYCGGRALEDMGAGRPVDEPTEEAA